MNRKILMGILIMVCCILTPKVNAQDSLLIRKMYEANGQHFQDPRAPRLNRNVKYTTLIISNTLTGTL